VRGRRRGGDVHHVRNFTAAAQERNVEVGVLIRDVDFATRVAAQWRRLATQGLLRVLTSR
jgi:phosphatidylserine/phosphatidylglycerophosphate/cardiolipin synthase-like enzyme